MAKRQLEIYGEQFAAGEIEKYEFYHLTRHYPAKLVSEVADIEVAVTNDRRRYLRQLAAQSKDYTIATTEGAVIAEVRHTNIEPST